jgi:DNA (cytosine-5)-methyltransferase 1
MGGGNAMPKIAAAGRIRFLTPRECWRLQGFSDELFEKAAAVNSDTQLYNQAGNSVSVPVIKAISERFGR